jgi:hypothetical protein
MSMFVQWQDDVTMLTSPRTATNLEDALKAAESTPPAHGPVGCGLRGGESVEAQTTPHVFVIDREGILRYRGSVDDVTFRQRKSPRASFWTRRLSRCSRGIFHADRISRLRLYHCARSLIESNRDRSKQRAAFLDKMHLFSGLDQAAGRHWLIGSLKRKFRALEQ